MLRAQVVLPALLLAGSALAGTAAAQHASAQGILSEVVLPGGLAAALNAIHDPLPGDRGQFLLEFIRRFYDSPIRIKRDPRVAVLQTLVAHLQASHGQTAATPDTLPLPFTPELWTTVVFGGRVAPQDLVAAIVQSRDTSLFYTGLLSLDDDTRAWLAGEPELIREIVSRYSAAFQVAASALRVRGGTVRVPGGAPAEAGWEALAGHRVSEPAGFVRAVLAEREGRLAYFLAAMGDLATPQIRFALGLESNEPASRISTARRLFAVFDRLALRWHINQHAFWRPALDPALLVADLRTNGEARPLVPGTIPFWQAVFTDTASEGQDMRALAGGEPVDFAWLAGQVFEDAAGMRGRYQQVLFASRILTGISADAAGEAVEAVRAMGRYPALALTLERAGLRDITLFAAAARQADRLSRIDDSTRAVRSIAQFQGVVALIARAVRRGSLPESELPSLISSLAAVKVSERGDYEGRMVRWIEQCLHAASELPDTAQGSGAENDGPSYDGPYLGTPGSLERDLLHLLSGASSAEPRVVDWEGTRYRLDVARAEATRISRTMREGARPYVSTAAALADLADALDQRGASAEQLRTDVEALRTVWPSDSVQGDAGIVQLQQTTAALQRAAADRDVAAARDRAPALRLLSDALLARGLVGLVYAAALGQPDRTPISAGEAAERHDFGFRSRQTGPWRLPVALSDSEGGWRVTGSLLGLDVALADRSLVRVSQRPLSRSPTLNGTDRRVFTEVVALIEPSTLTDEGRDAIVTAMQKGRARLAAVRTGADVHTVADEIRLAPARRSVLAWMVAHEPDRLGAFLSPPELFWLGGGDSAALQAWGAPAGARLGCLCPQILDRRSWEGFAGRWNTGLMASAFPDLNLRLAELLAQLRMPAPLLPFVLGPATLDFVDRATSRDADDRRGLVEFVQGLRPEQVEEYLALLTTGGPLVPIGDAR